MKIHNMAIPGSLSVCFLAVVLVTGCGDTVPSRLVGSWKLVSISSSGATQGVLTNAAVTLELRSDGTLGGISGCNHYGGSFKAGSDGTIAVREMMMTEMACLDEGVMEQETAYLQALSTADSWQVSGATLVLSCSDGTVSMVFRSVGCGCTSAN